MEQRLVAGALGLDLSRLFGPRLLPPALVLLLLGFERADLLIRVSQLPGYEGEAEAAPAGNGAATESASALVTAKADILIALLRMGSAKP
ncbi:hypothetical protein [Streptomyces sp. NPDC057428]|uniref:hypothetical protein n=1 Tax=Streptomyces sp. NPDC057428 TaxID=3346129 RepID=UPI003699AE90